ncbi:hypothetical protein VPFG_00185 [Vibrio phage nt-1]|uniref:Antirestriction protein ArdA n=1 Tax=Vibrio phage nt-1 TaxID=115992 RepID=R9TIH9_9CAUD|nr:hypothetical protein VPFG_00185 [Vibrio phage nt-1]AGN30185.1 hypothetical protein VPFG_00185 [Vibrio phage nt-1]
MNLREREEELKALSVHPDDVEIAVTVSCAGMSNHYTVCPFEFKDFLDEHEGTSYIAFEWHNFPNDLQDEELDFDELDALFSLEDSQREICELLYDNRVCMSYEDAAEKVEDCWVFEGTKEEYAEHVTSELMGIRSEDIPAILRSNINWGDVFIDLDADGSIFELSRNRYLTVNQ